MNSVKKQKRVTRHKRQPSADSLVRRLYKPLGAIKIISKLSDFQDNMRCLLILLVLTVLIYGCKSAEEQQLCLQDYINEVKGTPEYVAVRSAAKDTVSNWISLDVKFFGHLDADTKWKIDSAVFFNEDKSKALLLLLKVYTKPDSKMDFVEMLVAEKKEDNWHFYSQGFPSIAFPRNLNSNQPYTFEKLSEISREELILGGYYTWRTCNINYDYVNDWFKEPLAEYHQDFLKRRNEN